MTFAKERGMRFWFKRIIFFPIALAAGIFIFGTLVMFLWNAIIPEVFGLNTITFWQALGILALSKILFGGFHSRRCHRGFPGRGRHDLWEKWHNLSPEEKENMRKKWKSGFESPAEPEKKV